MEFQGGGEVPHLDGAAGVSRDDEAAGARSGPGRSLALVDAKGSDCSPVHRLDQADPGPVGRRPDEQRVRFRDDALNEDLLVVLITVGTAVSRLLNDDAAMTAAGNDAAMMVMVTRAGMMMLRFLQAHDLERGDGGRTRLGGNHSPEAGHAPRPDVVVFSAKRHQQLLRQLDLGDWRPVNRKCLE